MENIELILPEIFISVAVMFLLIVGVYKKNSSKFVYNLSIITLLILFAFLINLYSSLETSLFDDSYKIDKLYLRKLKYIKHKSNIAKF